MIIDDHRGRACSARLAWRRCAFAVRAVNKRAVRFARRQSVLREAGHLHRRAELNVRSEKRRVSLNVAFVGLSGHEDYLRFVEIVFGHIFAGQSVAVVAETVAGRINPQALVGGEGFRTVKIAGRDKRAAGVEDNRVAENAVDDGYRVGQIARVWIVDGVVNNRIGHRFGLRADDCYVAVIENVEKSSAARGLKTAAVCIVYRNERAVFEMHRIAFLLCIARRIDKQAALDFPVGVARVDVNSGVGVVDKAAMIDFEVVALPLLRRRVKPVNVNSAIEIGKSDALEIKILRRSVSADGFDAVCFIRALRVKLDILYNDFFDAFADDKNCLIRASERDSARASLSNIVGRSARVKPVCALYDDARRQRNRRGNDIISFGKSQRSAVVHSHKSHRAFERNRVVRPPVADRSEIPDVVKTERSCIGRGNPVVCYRAGKLVARKCYAVHFIFALKTPFLVGRTRFHRNGRTRSRQSRPRTVASRYVQRRRRVQIGNRYIHRRRRISNGAGGYSLRRRNVENNVVAFEFVLSEKVESKN